ncbi:SDR family oxidoreductase [uncultured Enterovirga sp.]|uniref:SDR family oxidoreductase n=1 Tax=uncultured Enterovirga sp. TaxID=2026352 RepID=UPI0035CC70A8
MDPSRRRAIAGLTTGVAAALAAVPALSQGTAPASPAAVSGGGTAAAPLQDPTTKHPVPPFKRQEQPWPGLASRMDPRPDHGEGSYKGSGRLAGRKALVTGGDSGIGRAAVIAFAREGADVAINYLPAEESDAKEVLELIRAAGRKGVALPGDIRDEAFCQRLVADAARELGGLDILVNNAAYQHPQKLITDITTEQFDQTFKTNVYAMFWITKAAMAYLKPGASIITTTSVNAYDPSEQLLDYASTKAVNMNFTKALAKQLAPKGIRVNAVAPGPVWTPLQPSGGQFPDELPEFGEDTPLGRPGQPAELAGLYVLLASNEATFSTGQVFGAVGGNGGP